MNSKEATKKAIEDAQDAINTEIRIAEKDVNNYNLDLAIPHLITAISSLTEIVFSLNKTEISEESTKVQAPADLHWTNKGMLWVVQHPELFAQPTLSEEDARCNIHVALALANQAIEKLNDAACYIPNTSCLACKNEAQANLHRAVKYISKILEQFALIDEKDIRDREGDTQNER